MDYGRELVKGNIQTIILAALADQPLHGYGIAREIERRSEDALKFGEGSIYPALQVLEREGFIAGRWEYPVSGPARKVYAITESGLGELARRRQTWEQFSRTISRVIGGQPDAQPV